MRRLATTLLCSALISCTGDGSDDLDQRSDGEPNAVVFSPAPSRDTSHLARIEREVGRAQRSIDIAIYSYSDAGITRALAKAINERGVEVRFIYEDAGEHNRLTGDEKKNSRSGELEAAGVDVRFVNKIMHHKMMIVDGPRDDVDDAATARLVYGSANWALSAATEFDETTVFFDGNEELAVAMQREFDLMWEHSSDFALGQPKAPVASTADLDASDADDPGLEYFSTSANFTLSPSNPMSFRTIPFSTKVADQLVTAIQRARTSIDVATTHMSLRPVAEALIAAKEANPDLQIRVYLDQQEYISASGAAFQDKKVANCLAAATTEAQIFKCRNSGLQFSKQRGIL